MRQLVIRAMKNKAMRGLSAAVCVAISLGLVACTGEPKDTHPDQVLTKRRALFKQFTRTLEPIGLVAGGRREYKVEEFLTLAQDLEKLSSKPWVYFTADGNYPPTRSRPEVWSQADAFKQAQQHYQSSVKALVVAAQSGQLATVQKAVDDVTASCKACHKDFRFE